MDMTELTKEEKEAKEKKEDFFIRIGLAIIVLAGAGVLIYQAWRVTVGR